MATAEISMQAGERLQIGHVDGDLRCAVYAGRSRYPNTHTFVYADRENNIFEIEAIQDADFSVAGNVVRFRASYGGARGLYISDRHRVHDKYAEILGL